MNSIAVKRDEIEIIFAEKSKIENESLPKGAWEIGRKEDQANL